MIRAIILLTYVLTAFAAEPLGSIAYTPEELPKTGYFKDIFEDPETGKKSMSYCISCPDRLPNRRELVLVVYLHGCGGNEESFKWRQHAAKAAADHPEAIWLGLKSAGRCWANSDYENITKVMDWVIETYPVDQRRIFTRGFSSGAITQSRYSVNRHDVIAGCIQYGGGGKIGQFVKSPVNEGMEFYMVCGEADSLYQKMVIPQYKSLDAIKGRYVLRTITGYGHGTVLDGNSEINKHIMTDVENWMYALRHKTRGVYKEDLALLKEAHKEKTDKLWKDDKMLRELLRIGGPECTKLVIDGLKHKKDSIVSRAIAFCKQVNVSEAATMELAKVYLKHDDLKIRLSAGEALAKALNWRHQIPQEVMVKKLMDKKADDKEKLQSIAAIKVYVDYMLYGNHKNDMIVYKGLILALNDEAKSVRAAAFDILKKANKGEGRGFDPAMDKKERRDGLRSWENWLALTFKDVKA